MAPGPLQHIRVFSGDPGQGGDQKGPLLVGFLTVPQDGPSMSPATVSTGDCEVLISPPQIRGRLCIARRPRALAGKTVGSYVSGGEGVGGHESVSLDKKNKTKPV